MNEFELNQKVAGVPLMEYMASLLDRNEKQMIEIERGKLAVGILKQMNNRSRLLLDAAKFELKAKGFESAETAVPPSPKRGMKIMELFGRRSRCETDNDIENI